MTVQLVNSQVVVQPTNQQVVLQIVQGLAGRSLNDRGAWLTATLYYPLDFFTSGNKVYLVQVQHTSTSIAADLAAEDIREILDIAEIEALRDEAVTKAAEALASANASEVSRQASDVSAAASEISNLASAASAALSEASKVTSVAQAGVATAQAGIATTKAAEAAASAAAAIASPVAAPTHAATSKTTPVDADELALVDSAASWILKKLTWANLKATLLATWKDTTGGLVGLTSFKINFKNAANTFTSFLTNANTAARTYTFQDRDGTVADNMDIASLTNAVNPKAHAQAIAITAAASGSSGVTINDNDNLDVGAGSFTLVWRGSLPDWIPVATQVLCGKTNGSAGYPLSIYTDGKIRFRYGTVVHHSTEANSIPDGATAQIAAVVDSVNSTFQPYVNGLALGSAVPITITNISNTYDFNVLGVSALGTRYSGTCNSAHLFNRALTAAEVLDLYRNGVAESDKWGSQTGQTSGALTVGKRYHITTFVAGDSFTNVGAASNATGVEFVATGTTPTTWTNSSALKAIGAVLALEPEGIQPAPGQWLDSSSNKLHALQPATGSSLTRRKKTFEVRHTNTWAGTHEAQYIGGVNQAILPVGCFIERIVGVVAGGTIEDIILGDGSDTDHWVAVTTGLAAGTTNFTIANPVSDGTNYKMVVDPDANFTGSITWTITGIILD